MRRLAIIVPVVLLLLLACQPAARAQSCSVSPTASCSLQEGAYSVGGVTTLDDFSAFDQSGYDTSYGTGLGTLVYTFDPGASGTYNFDVVVEEGVSTPFFNEYGAASGTAAAGETYEIGNDYNAGLGGEDLATSTIYSDVSANGALPNTNAIPGTTSNYSDACTGPSCNGDVALALGFNFTLTSTEEATITLNFSPTAPAAGSGDVLEQVHPVDSSNNSAVDFYFTGNEVTSTVSGGGGGTTGVPEPSTLPLLGMGLAGLCLLKMRRQLA
jgi:PEP-CTERM motif-containing protein